MSFISTSNIRWAARITGTAILLFLLYFLGAHIFSTGEKSAGFRNTNEVLAFLLFPVSTITGLALAYRFEKTGGLITFLGLTGLFILRPDLMQNVLIVLPLIPAVLYIYAGLAGRK